ncbi:hypothetical protein BG004_000112, partial [Podila humilis]
MDGASTTRLRFKGSTSSRKHESYKSNPTTSDGSHSPSNHRRHSGSRSRKRSLSPSLYHHGDFEHDHDHDYYQSHRHQGQRRNVHSTSPSSTRTTKSSSRRKRRGRKGKQEEEENEKRHRRTAPDTFSDYIFDHEINHDLDARFQEEEQEEKYYYYHQEQQELEEWLLQEEHDDPWLAHLFDELSYDDPQDYHASRFESNKNQYHYYRNNSNNTGSKYDHIINNLSEDRYAEYMRQGMSFSSTTSTSTQKREAKEWAAWVEEQEQQKYRQEREKQRERDKRASQRRQEEKKRQQEREHCPSSSSMDSATNILRKKDAVDKARREYESRWSTVMAQSNVTVNEASIPWLPPMTPLLSNTPDGGLTLYEFLFLGTPADKPDIRRQLLRREQLKFHPDKFKQRFGSRLPIETTLRQPIMKKLPPHVKKKPFNLSRKGQARLNTAYGGTG